MQVLLSRVFRKIAPEANIRWATNVSEALGEWRIISNLRGKPDLVLADILLPGFESGVQLYDHAQAHSSDTPFLFMIISKF